MHLIQPLSSYAFSFPPFTHSNASFNVSAAYNILFYLLKEHFRGTLKSLYSWCKSYMINIIVIIILPKGN